MKHALLLLGLLLLPLPAAAEEDGYDRILKRFGELLSRSSLDRRADAFRLLDLENPRSLPPLRNVLEGEHWFLRGLAAETLSGVRDPALRAELRLDLLTHEETRVREGIALAFALGPEKGDAEALSEALTDEDWHVRRTAAVALRGIVSKESLDALIASLKSERDPRVAANVHRTLVLLTGQRFGRDAEAWARWWEQNRESEALEGLEEEVKRRKLEGLPIETVTVAERPGAGAGSGERLDFLVLAPLGWTHEVYRPYLDDLNRYGRVTYVKLPRIDEITGSSGYGPTVPEYPVGSLVKALEKLRIELGKRQVVVIGEGAAGWIAERYGIRHARHTAAVVILNGFVDSASYAAALARLARSPTPSERWVANTLGNQNSVPHDRDAHRTVSRVLLTADLMEPWDSRGWLLWKNARDPQGFVSVPEIRFPPRARIETPTLFYFGAKHRLSGLPEAERIRAHFKNNVIGVMRRSRGFPFVSDHAEFYRVLEGFLDYHQVR